MAIRGTYRLTWSQCKRDLLGLPHRTCIPVIGDHVTCKPREVVLYPDTVVFREIRRCVRSRAVERTDSQKRCQIDDGMARSLEGMALRMSPKRSARALVRMCIQNIHITLSRGATSDHRHRAVYEFTVWYTLSQCDHGPAATCVLRRARDPMSRETPGSLAPRLPQLDVTR